MDIRAQSKKRPLLERLAEISRDLERIRSGESKPEVVEYLREGDRVSVLIKPRDKNGAA
jgi:hypothetical protein